MRSLALHGKTVVRAGFRWGVDPYGDIIRVPDEGLIQSVQSQRARFARTNNHSLKANRSKS
jgi:hypothetical protein